MHRCICIWIFVITFGNFKQIYAVQEEISVDELDLASVQLNLWLNLNRNIELIMGNFEKIDKNFAETQSELQQLHGKLEASERNAKKQMQIIEKKFESLKDSVEHVLKISQYQNTAKFEKLENMLKMHNAENQNFIDNFELKLNQNKLEIVSKLNRLQNGTQFYENLKEASKSALQNVENQLNLQHSGLEVLKQLNSSLERLGREIENAKPADCSQWKLQYCQNSKCWLHNKIYGPQAFLAACDQQTDHGGWTVIQRRLNGSVDFYRDWHDYKQGFGSLDGEFWLGLDKLHALTSSENMELRITLRDFNETEKYANYDAFKIANETEKYALQTIGAYVGNAGNAFGWHVGMHFTTKDQDNDKDEKANCAIDKHGAWWYESCGWW